MIGQDKLEKERNDAKNAVEEYLYDLRNKLCGVYEKYITEEVKAGCYFERKQGNLEKPDRVSDILKCPTNQISPRPSDFPAKPLPKNTSQRCFFVRAFH